MTTQARQRKAEELQLNQYIGRKVKSVSDFAFRSGDTAEIVGWGFANNDTVPVFFIRFENNECDMICAGDRFKLSGYVFMD